MGAGGPLTIIDSEIYENNSNLAGGGAHLNSTVAFQYQIVGSTIRDNTSGGRGGGVFSVVPGGGSEMRIVDSVISNNVAALDGGGIASTGLLFVSRSVIRDNESAMNGGGIMAVNGLTIETSLIDDNLATIGGGIHADAIVTIGDSTISNNEGTDSAGGIYLQNSNSTLSQLTVSLNQTDGAGGGIFTTQAITIRHSTIANNRAFNGGVSGGGAGIFGGQPIGMPIILEQSIVATNTWNVGTRDDIVGAVAVSYSLIGDETGATITDNGGNKIGTFAMPEDPLLDPLAPYDSLVLRGGAHLLTHRLQDNSPALDAGNPAAMGGTFPTPSFDERGMGFVRVYNATGLPMAQIDMGAHERQPSPLFVNYNGDDIVNAADYTVWRNTLGSTFDLRADGDRNLVVDHNDYLYWKEHFGETPEIGSGSVLASGQLTVEPVSDSSPVSLEASAPSSGESQSAFTVSSRSFVAPGPTVAPIARVVSQLAPPATGGAGDDAQDDALLALSAIPAGSTPLRSGDATAQAEDESPADDSAAGEDDPLDAAFAELGAGGL